MPKPLKNMRIKDPFVMDEDTVNEYVAEFLTSAGFANVSFLTGNERGRDVTGEKLGWTIFVESKGSQANHHAESTVFGTRQIKQHTYVQVGKLMEYRNASEPNVLLAMANPNIPRIRERVQKISKSVDMLGFIRIWVSHNKEIEIDCPNGLKAVMGELHLMPIQ